MFWVSVYLEPDVTFCGFLSELGFPLAEVLALLCFVYCLFLKYMMRCSQSESDKLLKPKGS